MKEEIGKIIDKNIDNNFTFEKNAFKNNQYCLADEIWNILDKYDNQPDYKSAFKKLKQEFGFETVENMNGKKDCLGNFMQELEQKYNLGGE